MRSFQSYAVQNLTVYSEINFPLRRRVLDKTLLLCVSAGNKMPISPDRCKSRVARNRNKNRAPSCDFRYAKLLVLLVGGPDDFVAGASRAHPPRPLRGGRIVLVGQHDRLRRQSNVAIHKRSFACGTISQKTEV